ncbi:MAG: hypothetical protein K2N06_09915 [Oscillospiraceae bacterium]|nr:hypothetical protein [Oscillospiraceae bacterium]
MKVTITYLRLTESEKKRLAEEVTKKMLEIADNFRKSKNPDKMSEGLR